MSKNNLTKEQNQKLSEFLNVVMILVMLSNIEHCANVYYWISKNTFETFFAAKFPEYIQTGVLIDWIVSYVVVIVFDLAVIVLVRAGKYFSASVYAIGILLLLLVYYDGLSFFDRDLVDKRVAQITFSVFFAFSIVRFSMLYSELKQNSATQDQNEATLKQLEADKVQMLAGIEQLETKLKQKSDNMEQVVSKYKRHYAKFHQELTDKNKLLDNVKKQNAIIQQHLTDADRKMSYTLSIMKEERLCPYCATSWESKSAMVSHKGSCEHKPKKEKQNVIIK